MSTTTAGLAIGNRANHGSNCQCQHQAGHGVVRRLTRKMAVAMVTSLLRPGGGFTLEQAVAFVKERTGFDVSSDFAMQSEETFEQTIARYRRETAHLEVHDTALFLLTDGERIHAVPVARTDELPFAAPAPYFASQDDGRDGGSHGVPEVERRREERDLRRELDKARKRLRGAPVADRATWEAKVNALEAELRALTSPRDEERDRQRSTTGD